jgi:hypothetical protein
MHIVPSRFWKLQASRRRDMGRPIGSVNRDKPFTDALRVALLSGGGRRLRIIADKLADKAEQGDLHAIREIADRLDGKCAQAIERGNAAQKCSM